MHYTENVHTLVMTMRMIPARLHRFAAPLILAYWRVRASLEAGKRFLAPYITERSQDGVDHPRYNDLLQWMIDMGRPEEISAPKLAHRQLLMSLAATHTTGMAATHVILDLCAYPEYLEEVRKELCSVLETHGGWQKSIIHKLRKLDSFMRESQRLSPPALSKEPLKMPFAMLLLTCVS